MQSFVTGSQVYGKPTQSSDLDLVMWAPREVALALASQFENTGSETEESGSVSVYIRTGSHVQYPMPDAIQRTMFVQGMSLNLIICWSPLVYGVWKDGTEECKALAEKIGPITRDQAKGVFHRLRKERGVPTNDDKA